MAHNNIISAHTADGCTQDSSINGLYSGQQLNTQCAVGTDNIGCGFNASPEDVSSYGDGFNAAHGGVYAMEWNEEHIRIWHFARGSIPRDVENKQPDPESWGQPVAVFGGSSCDVDTYFKNMRLVLNIVSTRSIKNTYIQRKDKLMVTISTEFLRRLWQCRLGQNRHMQPICANMCRIRGRKPRRIYKRILGRAIYRCLPVPSWKP